jgi:hypothetical protein
MASLPHAQWQRIDRAKLGRLPFGKLASEESDHVEQLLYPIRDKHIRITLLGRVAV